MSLLKGKDCQNESHPTSSIFPDGGKKIKEETGFFQRFIREKTRRWIGLGLIGVFVFLIADKYIKWSNIEGWVVTMDLFLTLRSMILSVVNLSQQLCFVIRRRIPI